MSRRGPFIANFQGAPVRRPRAAAVSRPGLFITLEGGEGAGKSTAGEFLKHALGESGIDLLCTREPGGTPLGERLRSLLLDPEAECVDPMAELLMMFAARAQHLSQLVLPALARGQWVLCDRFTDASYAYQGAGRGLGAHPVSALENLVQGERRPDLTLLLDVPVGVGMERARGRGALNRFERETVEFLERVRQAYLRRAAQDEGRYRVIDGARPLADVERALRALVDDLLAPRPTRAR